MTGFDETEDSGSPEPDGRVRAAPHRPRHPTVVPESTHRIERARRGQMARRITLTLILVFVVLGLVGAFGYRQGHQRAAAAGYEVDLGHPAVTRGGLPASWTLTVRRTDGGPLDGTIAVTTTAAYFGSFDHNVLDPEPDRTWQDDETLQWEFDADGDADSLSVSIDLRTQPNARWPQDATTTVEVDGERVAALDYRTWILP
jgi:hypothetical protein